MGKNVNVVIELNHEGIQALLKSTEVADMLADKAGEIAARAGEGYETCVYNSGNRARASVRTATYQAYREQMENNTLLKALG